MKKIIVTGANGVGKSHFSRTLAEARPDVPMVCIDALKLRTGWQQRPRGEVEEALDVQLAQDAWILDGGPSFLPQAIPHADALVWLDPRELIRTWQLLKRPWLTMGRTRPELPYGNVDWPLRQYRFAWQSLQKRAKVRQFVEHQFSAAEGLIKWRCQNASDRNLVILEWRRLSKD